MDELFIEIFARIFLGILFGLIALPIVAGLLYVFSITITVINFNWIFVGVISFAMGLIFAHLALN